MAVLQHYPPLPTGLSWAHKSAWANIRRKSRLYFDRCRFPVAVSPHKDLDGVNHAALRSKRSRSMRPVALAAAEFRQGEIITDTPGAMAEFCVTLLRQAVPVGAIILLESGATILGISATCQHANTRKAAESLAPSLAKAAKLIR